MCVLRFNSSDWRRYLSNTAIGSSPSIKEFLSKNSYWAVYVTHCATGCQVTRCTSLKTWFKSGTVGLHLVNGLFVFFTQLGHINVTNKLPLFSLLPLFSIKSTVTYQKKNFMQSIWCLIPRIYRVSCARTKSSKFVYVGFRAPLKPLNLFCEENSSKVIKEKWHPNFVARLFSATLMAAFV